MTPSLEQSKSLQKRLARIEGQLRGIQKLIGNEAECETVLQQMTAARKALDRTFFEMIACLVESTAINAHNSNHAERITEIRKLLSKYA